MRRQTFEQQPYYHISPIDGMVRDVRFPNGTIHQTESLEPYKFPGEQLALDMQEVKRHTELPHEVTDKDYVYGVTSHRQLGRDGEDWSGFVELVQIYGHDKVGAVIHAGLFSHWNGYPDQHTSWAIDFSHFDAAKDFFKLWRPTFNIETAASELEDIGQILCDEVVDHEAYIYPVGVLKPWFQQTTTDVIYNNHFSSRGKHLVAFRETGNISYDFIPGVVYKRPEYGPENHSVATCLGALALNPEPDYMRKTPRLEVAVQWDDGEFIRYDLRELPEQLPLPLSEQDISMDLKPR